MTIDEQHGQHCTTGRCEWKRIRVRDVFGVREETFECTYCKASKLRTGMAPTLGDRHYREE